MRWLSLLTIACCVVWGAPASALDLAPFFAQYECPDGGPPMTCPGAKLTRMEYDGEVHVRYHDWAIGVPDGYMTADAYHWFDYNPDHQYFVKIWEWPGMSEANGGEVYEIYRNGEGIYEARILGTKDIGTPGQNQFFNPCEDHGWVVAREDVPSERWDERNYGQRATKGSPGCPEPLNHGFTRTRLEWLNIPLQRADGWIFYINARAIISRQYNNSTFDRANRSESFVCIEYYGCRIWWLSLKGEAGAEDLDYRNPKIKWVEPDRGWRLGDIRATLKYVTGNMFKPKEFGWPW